MSTASLSPTFPEMNQAGLSEAERVINTFVAPSKTFADMKKQGFEVTEA